MKTTIVNCNVCGKEISSDAKRCPNCGAKVKKKIPVWRKVIAIPLLIVGIIGIIGAFSESGESSGAEDHEVTMQEFMDIKSGMTYSEVVNIIGFEGELTSQVDLGEIEILDEKLDTNTEIYIWKNVMSNATVVFQGGKVTSKSQIGLE